MLNGSEGNDIFSFGTADFANDINITPLTSEEVTSFDAGGGNTDTVNITSANETATLTGGNIILDNEGVTISGINTLITMNGLMNTLVNQSGTTFRAVNGSVAGMNVSGFDVVNSPSVSLAATPNTVTVDAAGEFTFNSTNFTNVTILDGLGNDTCLLYTSPSPRDKRQSRMPSSA